MLTLASSDETRAEERDKASKRAWLAPCASAAKPADGGVAPVPSGVVLALTAEKLHPPEGVAWGRSVADKWLVAVVASASLSPFAISTSWRKLSPKVAVGFTPPDASIALS